MYVAMPSAMSTRWVGRNSSPIFAVCIFFLGGGKEQFWGSCLHYYAYRKMVGVKNCVCLSDVLEGK